MTIEEMYERVRKSELTKPCYVSEEAETKAILLRTRRPPKIVDGLLVGTEIDLYGPGEFRVWTDRVRRARRIAKQYAGKVKLRNLDGESELIVPGELADIILPQFYLTNRRILTEAQKDAARARLAQNLKKRI